jgi:hypothetical protein
MIALGQRSLSPMPQIAKVMLDAYEFTPVSAYKGTNVTPVYFP